MRRWILTFACLAFAIPDHARTQQDELIARGKYLVTAVMTCNACHTPFGPNGPDMSKMLSGGRTFDEPAFKVTAPNITPDPEFGIGKWSDADFIRALREGLSPRGQHYFPVFPYPAYTKMTTQDLLDLKAYLATIAPSKKPSRAHEVGLPYSIRLTLMLTALAVARIAALVAIIIAALVAALVGAGLWSSVCRLR